MNAALGITTEPLDAAQRDAREWAEVLVPPAQIMDRVGRLAAAQGLGVLSADQLAALVSAMAQDEALWAPLAVTDASRRRYRLAYEDERIDVWVLSWMPGQATGFHDHGTSAVALTTVRGAVRERRLNLVDGEREQIMRPGVVQAGPAGYVHAVNHHEGRPALSIHAYSPPLGEVGQYRPDLEGNLWREAQDGRKELREHGIQAPYVAARSAFLGKR